MDEVTVSCPRCAQAQILTPDLWSLCDCGKWLCVSVAITLLARDAPEDGMVDWNTI